MTSECCDAHDDKNVPLATAALNAGKHVIVDKPFTITLAEARRLRDLSRAKGRLLSVFQKPALG